MKTKIFIAALILITSAGITTAQEKNQVSKENTKTLQTGPEFLDSNNNSVCDNFENGTPRNPNATGRYALHNGSGAGKGQAMGLHNGSGRGRGMGKGYGLHNGTGRGSAQGMHNGTGRNHQTGTYYRSGLRDGLRNGKGAAVNFIDADKNNTCDRRETK
ncbi:MAG: hypothetical protein PHP30_08040 [Bacteroidales bacterium]|nr:hypothetical protein [Bacteroidales bacterium]MDD2425553.1 hypothetical protein [Bacteroidales bacterium]MDD3990027.1 hypothetical protein [Bacteroidales bacterium]